MQTYAQKCLDGRLRASLAYVTTRRRRRRPLGARQNQREQRAATDLALDHELTVHGSGELAADRKAKTDSIVRTIERTLALDEWLEDVHQPVGGNAAAGIANVDTHARSVSLTREQHGAAIGRVLDGVPQQIQQNLREAIDVGAHVDIRRARTIGKLQRA